LSLMGIVFAGVGIVVSTIMFAVFVGVGIWGLLCLIAD